jgi:hypothetical protein
MLFFLFSNSHNFPINNYSLPTKKIDTKSRIFGQYFIDIGGLNSYTAFHKKKVLIKDKSTKMIYIVVQYFIVFCCS